ncbi:MAG TPA: type I methionyl aminopeptidase [Patescibacteria group bacterium]
MTIRPKTSEELDIMRESGKRLNAVLKAVNDFITVGKSLQEIDAYAYDLIIKSGAKPSFLGYLDYPASTCLSVNDAVVHGIPDDYILKEGDLIGVDIGVCYEGYHTDAAFTKGIGAISKEAKKLLQVTQEALGIALEATIAGNTVGDIGSAVEAYVKSQGKYGIVRDLSGHGVGKNLQESPEILNYAAKNPTPLVNGMTLAIEPMINLGDWRVVVDDDDWTVRTRDGMMSAHFETTVIVQDNDPEVLVDFPLDFPC